MLDGKAIKPLYEQLKEKIESEIAEGKYKPGDRLLSEVELAEKYDVSVITVRKATNDLSKIGLLEKRQGKGTFVASRKYNKDLNQVLSFSEACKLIGAVPGAKVLASELVEPNKNVLEQMELPDNSKTVYISRLRLVNDEPMVIEDNYFSLKYSFLLEEDLNKKSLFEILSQKSGTQVVRSRRTIEICRATAFQASQLNVKRNSPLLLVQGVVYGLDNEIVYLGIQIINGERYKLHV
ncbi:GntR family transcriptional regulator [Bacillus salipaludis]|uniref:GntR family transcriptional regulator n=1 Tax=Bacillus salipaludis TaxID=2547811 RepID=A0ABW8RMP9_9BACI